MTTEEKAAAFDTLCVALTNRWSCGYWTWWCSAPCGGARRDTREEAVADLVAWAAFTAPRREKQLAERHPLLPGRGEGSGQPAAGATTHSPATS